MQASLLTQGLDLMVYGMGTVFVFLALLILVTSLMSRLVGRFFPETPIASKPVKAVPVKAGVAVDAQTLQAIKLAIQQHRARRR